MSVSPEAAAAFPRCPGCSGPMPSSMLYEISFLAIAFRIITTRGPILPVRRDTLKAFLLTYGLSRFGSEYIRARGPGIRPEPARRSLLIPLIGLLVVHFARRLRSRVPAAPPRACHAAERRSMGPDRRITDYVRANRSKFTREQSREGS